MNVFKYIAEKNLQPTIAFLKSIGYPDPKAKNMAQLKERVGLYLADYYKRNKDNPQVIVDIVKLHPDRSIIEKTISIPQTTQAAQSVKSSADGCEQGKWSNCSGCPLIMAADATKPEVVPGSKLSQQSINMIIIGGSVIIITALISTIYFSNKKA